MDPSARGARLSSLMSQKQRCRSRSCALALAARLVPPGRSTARPYSSSPPAQPADPWTRPFDSWARGARWARWAPARPGPSSHLFRQPAEAAWVGAGGGVLRGLPAVRYSCRGLRRPKERSRARHQPGLVRLPHGLRSGGGVGGARGSGRGAWPRAASDAITGRSRVLRV